MNTTAAAWCRIIREQRGGRGRAREQARAHRHRRAIKHHIGRDAGQRAAHQLAHLSGQQAALPIMLDDVKDKHAWVSADINGDARVNQPSHSSQGRVVHREHCAHPERKREGQASSDSRETGRACEHVKRSSSTSAPAPSPPACELRRSNESRDRVLPHPAAQASKSAIPIAWTR